ncbi:hypothetical protein [Kitasatospora aureofaciens]|uniref:hypothetical protein n=1 Tax=Kitasatospora aureofaciens TaxID=1894 RepID=UPI000523FFA2|nr:hypothetical protein [Kitasatospora aureofaciens]
MLEVLGLTAPAAAVYQAMLDRMATVYQQVFGHPTDVVYRACEQLTVEERGAAMSSSSWPAQSGQQSSGTGRPASYGSGASSSPSAQMITDDGITRIPSTPA